MSKHKLFHQLRNSLLLDSGMLNDRSPAKAVRPAATDSVTPALGGKVKKTPGDVGVNEKQKLNSCETSSEMDCEPGHESSSDDNLYPSCCKNKANSRLPYTLDEDEWILCFVLKGENLVRVSSNLLWKYLEAKKEKPKRTYQSLKNRFWRNIKPHLFTRFRHLITDERIVENILAKFPELKKTVGTRSTLPGLKLPSRSAVSNVDHAKRHELPEGGKSTQPQAADCQPGCQESSNLNLFRLKTYRTVVIDGDSTAVTVNYEKHLEKGTPSSLGIYEKYKKLVEKNPLVLCTACGRYNKPKRGSPDNSSQSGDSSRHGDSDVLIGNSLDSPKSGEKVVSRRKERTLAKRRKVEEPIVEGDSPGSPSLLGNPRDGSPRDGGTDALQVAEASNSGGPKTAAQPPAGNQSREVDDYVDSPFEDTIKDLRKLISSEEEQLLVKKCFLGKQGILGVDSLLEMSLDSYFVDLSPNLEMSSSTNSLSISSGDCRRESENGNPRSLLAKNMLKMLGGNVKAEQL